MVWKSREEGEIEAKMQGGGQMKCWEQGDIDEKVTFSILAMKMLAKATAIFVPMVVPWVYRQLLRQNWDDYSVNIEYFRYLVGIRALSLPWLRPLRGMLVQRRSAELSQARTQCFCIRHPVMAFQFERIFFFFFLRLYSEGHLQATGIKN